MQIKSYRDLLVWQKAIILGELIYKVTNTFPKEELFGLVSQMRRSSVSIASNIAEGRHRGTRKDFVQFLRIALGSVAELETQIELTKRTLFKNADCFSEIDIILNEISRMLKVMIRKLST